MDRKEELQFIRAELEILGLKSFPEKEIADKIRSGESKIQIAGTMQFNPYGSRQDMDYTIYLKHYELPNLYAPYMMEAVLKDQPDLSRVFSTHNTFNLQDTFNMLHGRAVVKTVFDPAFNLPVRNSFQLDFNNKDEHGNIVMNSHPADFIEGDIQTILSKYRIKENQNPEDRLHLTHSILRGNPTPITLFRDGKTVKAFVELQGGPTNVSIYTVPEITQTLKGKPLIDKVELELHSKVTQTNKKNRSKGKSL